MRRSRGRIDREVEEKILFHLDMRTKANIAAGMKAGAARRRASLRRSGACAPGGPRTTRHGVARQRFQARELVRRRVAGPAHRLPHAVAQPTRHRRRRHLLGSRDRRQHRQLQLRVVGRALKLAGIGAAIGLVAAVGFARALEGVLYGVSVNNPVPYFSVVGLILLAAALASYLPARRASRVDPTDALRAE